MQDLQPKTAKKIGIRSQRDWPYGPSDDSQARTDLIDWASRHDLRLSHGSGWCRHWLLNRKCYFHHADATGQHWEDHPTCWWHDGQRAVFVAQPYSLQDPSVPEKWARENGFEVTIDPSGGWYGHGTVFIAMYDPDVISKVTT